MREKISDVRGSADTAEASTYAYSDSVSGVSSRPTEQPATVLMPTDSMSGGDVERLRSIASHQVIYYESLIDSLLYENFRLKLDIAVMQQRNHRADGDNYDCEADIDTGIAGLYTVGDDLTIGTLLAEIERNGIKHPRVVLAQAILETGWFKSRVCRTHNNLFGLRQPWDGEYFRFARWQDSVRAYRTKVQYKYKGGPYLRWLRELGYAEDPDYTDKLWVLLTGPLKGL